MPVGVQFAPVLYLAMTGKLHNSRQSGGAMCSTAGKLARGKVVPMLFNSLAATMVAVPVVVRLWCSALYALLLFG